MPIFTVKDVGGIGVVMDLEPHRLPPNAFTSSINVRFSEGVATPSGGYDVLEPLTSETIDAIYWVHHFYSGASDWWVIPGLDSSAAKVISFTLEGTEKDITPTGGETLAIGNGDQWSGGSFMGNCIIANGRSSEVFYINTPDAVSPVMLGLSYSSGVDLYDRLRFDVVRPWKNYLLGIGVQVVPAAGLAGVDQGYYPNLIWWSDAAGPGEIPGSWEADDPTTLAGYLPFGSIRAELLDGTPLGDRFLLHGANTTYTLNYVGYPGIFQPAEDFISLGILAPNCVAMVELKGRPTHVILGSGDVYATDGVSVRSILNQKWRRYLFSVIDPDYYRNSFVVAHQRENEVWICYPEDEEQYPNRALIWNYLSDTLYLRELPTGTTFAAWGRQSTGEPIFGVIDSVTAIIDTVTDLIDAKDDYQPGNQTLISVDLSANIFRHEQGKLFNEVSPTCRLTREGLPVEGDSSAFKIVTELWPQMTCSTDMPIEIRIGTRAKVDDETVWGAWQEFTPGTDHFLPVIANGRLHSWDVRSTNGADWRLYAMDMKWEFSGRF